jgi:hypothetical protein
VDTIYPVSRLQKYLSDAEEINSFDILNVDYKGRWPRNSHPKSGVIRRFDSVERSMWRAAWNQVMTH